MSIASAAKRSIKQKATVNTASEAPLTRKDEPLHEPVTLPCGCTYVDKGWMLTRVNECEYHKRKRTTKRQYKPKAECVRP